MIYFNEKDREFHEGDHGPKLLEMGPSLGFGVLVLKAGETVFEHKHCEMQEALLVVAGSVEIVSAGMRHACVLGDYIRLEPAEVCELHNPGEEEARLVFALAPGTAAGGAAPSAPVTEDALIAREERKREKKESRRRARKRSGGVPSEVVLADGNEYVAYEGIDLSRGRHVHEMVVDTKEGDGDALELAREMLMDAADMAGRDVRVIEAKKQYYPSMRYKRVMITYEVRGSR